MSGVGQYGARGGDPRATAERGWPEQGQRIRPAWQAIVRSVAVLILVALPLAACGKKGPPEPPGPADKITYPRIYPTR